MYFMNECLTTPQHGKADRLLGDMYFIVLKLPAYISEWSISG